MGLRCPERSPLDKAEKAVTVGRVVLRIIDVLHAVEGGNGVSGEFFPFALLCLRCVHVVCRIWVRV